MKLRLDLVGGLSAALVFGVALTLYVATLAPGLLWGGGDFATFQTRLFLGELRGGIFGHPLWVIVARPFVWLPIRDVAYRANLAAAVFAALALVCVFLSAHRLTRSLWASLLATGALMVSHTFWTYAVMPKVYSLNALMLALCIYLLIRWEQEQRAANLYAFALLYGLSLLNHLVMATAAAGFVFYILRVGARQWRQWIIAACFFLFGAMPYGLLWLSTEQSASGAVFAFLRGFLNLFVSPDSLWLGISLGVALLLYQFPLTVVVGIVGARTLWREQCRVAWMLLLIALGDVAFLLGATDPRTGGEYVWNLHYYLQAYIVFALWIASGFVALQQCWTNWKWQSVIAMATIGVPILAYALAPMVVRPFLANVPGFRELPGRDNVAYVLAPWKHNETGARSLGESILAALPPHSILFADYSIWAVIRYLQVVEGARPDVQLVELPGAGAHQQLPLIQTYRGELFLADVNRYYDVNEIEKFFVIVPAPPVYRIVPR